MTRPVVTTLLLTTVFAPSLAAQDSPPDLVHRLEALEARLEAQSFAMQRLAKKVDDVLWFDRVGDVAAIDKVYIPTVPAPKQEETYGITGDPGSRPIAPRATDRPGTPRATPAAGPA